MNDKELLLLAAKAAGYRIECAISTLYPYGDVFFFGGKAWNPRTDDGEGARLEAALGIHVAWHSDGVVCGLRWAGCTELFDDHGGDKQAARRMASLRVAAEQGKAML